MRIFLLAAVSACVAGAAWADAPAPESATESAYSARIADEVMSAVDAALSQAMADIEVLPMDDRTRHEVRTAIEAARFDVRLELAARDGRLDSLTLAEEAELETALESALRNVTAAVDRAAVASAMEEALEDQR